MEYVNKYVKGMAVTWRNKDMTRPLTQEQVEYFSNLATQTPSKQSNKYFDIVAITNQKLIYKIYKNSKVPDPDRVQPYNPQVVSPLLLLWMSCDLETSKLADNRYIENMEQIQGDDVFVDTHQSVGISAGVVSYEANRLGFQTGFCRCLETDSIIDDLIKDYNWNCTCNEPDIFLALGIGYGLVKDNPRWHGLKNFQMVSHKGTNPEIFYIN